MKTIALALLIATAAFALTPEQQLDAALTQQKAASLLVNQLSSQIAAARIDSLYQLDPTLVANHVRIVGSSTDSMWVKIALDKLAPLDLKVVKAELKGADLNFQATSSPDTLYMRRDRAEKALPVISAALKD